MLALSSTSETLALKGVIEHTKAIVFLGTPHRGSPEFSAIGERARFMLSSLPFQTTGAILDTLRQSNADLLRAHESFTRLWQQYNFRVKTFQEGFGLTRFNLWVLGNKVVPHDSSLIGDPREHAETLQANHIEMCRFSSASDPNFLKVAGEIKDIYTTIAEAVEDALTKEILAKKSIALEDEVETRKALDILRQKLGFEGMDRRKNSISPAIFDTGRWLFVNRRYDEWTSEWNFDSHLSHHLLLIRGKPGAGKSTLMKEAVQHTESHWKGDSICASFFIDGSVHDKQHRNRRVLRSLLYQLLPHTKVSLSSPQSTEAKSMKKAIREAAGSTEDFSLQELQTLLTKALEVLVLEFKFVFIFVDALDELQEDESRKHVVFWSDLIRLPKFQKLRVCLSCRHFPNITVVDCLELALERHNGADIISYIKQRLESRMSLDDADWNIKIYQRIRKRSAGVFLWVALVVDKVLAKYDYGSSLRNLLRLVDDTPTEIQELYIENLCSLDGDERDVALRVFQWVIAAARPLRLDEWHHVLAFVRDPRPTSLRDWRQSYIYTHNDTHLEREIKSLSRGLLEVSHSQCSNTDDVSSIDAGAGSLDQEQGSARVVQFTHPSIYDFFVNRQGFKYLGYNGKCPVKDCHSTIVSTCLAYINVPELDAFILARQRVEVASLTTLSLYSAPSYRSLHSNISQRNEEFAISLRQLHTMPPTDPCQLVRSWLTDRGLPPCPDYNLEDSDSSSSSACEISQRPKIDGNPALLLYLVNELHFHLEIAKKGTFAKSIIEKLEESGSRWKMLRSGQRTEFTGIKTQEPNVDSSFKPLTLVASIMR
ncbi:hypothetical protein ACHAP5_011674 [Fusarium lateritium]